MKRLEYFFSTDECGQIVQRTSWERFINNIAETFPGKRIKVLVEQKRKIRSLPQNRYYFGVIVEEFRQAVFEQWGDDIGKQEAHETLKRHCNYEEICNRETGEVKLGKNNLPLILVKSTADLTTAEVEQYYERCRKLIYEYFNVQVPLPNEQKTVF